MNYENPTNTETIALKEGGFLLLCTCPDPDTCPEEHNEIVSDDAHHYGCDCDLCFDYYKSLK